MLLEAAQYHKPVIDGSALKGINVIIINVINVIKKL